jgi:hypothetical protein
VAKIPHEIAARVDGYVSKYMEMLKIDGTRPNIKLANNRRPDWLARMIWNVDRPPTFEFQKALFKNDKNDKWLERTIAHEMIHYQDALARAKDDRMVEDDHAGLGHGASFREGADRINTKMGSDFVAEAVVKLPSGTFLSLSDLELAQRDAGKKVMLVLGFGGLAVLCAALVGRKRRSAEMPPPHEHERGSYGTK